MGNKSSKEEIREAIRGYLRTARRQIAKKSGADFVLISEENVGDTLEQLKSFLKSFN